MEIDITSDQRDAYLRCRLEDLDPCLRKGLEMLIQKFCPTSSKGFWTMTNIKIIMRE